MTFAIDVKKRDKGQIERLRESGDIPAVLYGPEITPVMVSIASNIFQKLYRETGESTLIDLTVEGKSPAKVLIQDVQYDPVKGSVIHVDFRQINMNKEMTTPIDIAFTGEPAAVKELGGTLVKPIEKITVRCLPKDLVGSITVDLSRLKTFDDVIRVADLALPPGLTVLDHPEALVAKVAPPLTEEQLKAMEAAGPQSLDEIEVSVERGKKEEDGAAADSDEKASAK